MPGGQDGPQFCFILKPHCLPNSLPLQEKDVSIHRDREGGRDRETHIETVRKRDRKKERETDQRKEERGKLRQGDE